MCPLLSSTGFRNFEIGSASDYVSIKEMSVSNNLTPCNYQKSLCDELQKARTFLENYVLCHTTGSKPGKSKLEMDILSQFNFLARTPQKSHIPGDMRVLCPHRWQGVLGNSPREVVMLQTLWASAERHTREDTHFQGLQEVKRLVLWPKET